LLEHKLSTTVHDSLKVVSLKGWSSQNETLETNFPNFILMPIMKIWKITSILVLNAFIQKSMIQSINKSEETKRKHI
jgi:hypothetical protein